MAELRDLIELFLRVAEAKDKRRVQCTGAIARGIGAVTPVVRKELLRMEKAGTVKRYRPWCRQGALWWERVACAEKAAVTLSNITPPRNLGTQLPTEGQYHASSRCYPSCAPARVDDLASMGIPE